MEPNGTEYQRVWLNYYIRKWRNTWAIKAARGEKEAVLSSDWLIRFCTSLNNCMKCRINLETSCVLSSVIRTRLRSRKGNQLLSLTIITPIFIFLKSWRTTITHSMFMELLLKLTPVDILTILFRIPTWRCLTCNWERTISNYFLSASSCERSA